MSHLQVVNDPIFFSSGKEFKSVNLLSVLGIFKNVFGIMVNLSKGIIVGVTFT